MGDKDISEKALLRYADVFADIVNVLLFDGEQRILPNDLTEVDPHTYYNGKQRQNVQIQDIVKYWKKEIQHVEETLYLLSAISDDRRFEEISFNRDEEVPHNMCEILDRVEQRGFQAGYEQGIEQGIEQGVEKKNLSLAKMMLRDKEPVDKIERYTGYATEKLKEIAESIGITLSA